MKSPDCVSDMKNTLPPRQFPRDFVKLFVRYVSACEYGRLDSLQRNVVFYAHVCIPMQSPDWRYWKFPYNVP